MVATSEHCDFWRVSNIAEILKGTEPGPSFSQLVHDHSSQLSKEFEHHFPATKDPQAGKEWIWEHLLISQVNWMTVLYKNDCAWDCKIVVLKVHLRQLQISVKFRIQVREEYLEMATKALKNLLPCTSSLCHAGFSAAIATKTRLWLDMSNTLGMSLPPITSKWDCLAAGKFCSGLLLILHYGESYNYSIIITMQ